MATAFVHNFVQCVQMASVYFIMCCCSLDLFVAVSAGVASSLNKETDDFAHAVVLDGPAWADRKTQRGSEREGEKERAKRRGANKWKSAVRQSAARLASGSRIELEYNTNIMCILSYYVLFSATFILNRIESATGEPSGRHGTSQQTDQQQTRAMLTTHVHMHNHV